MKDTGEFPSTREMLRRMNLDTADNNYPGYVTWHVWGNQLIKRGAKQDKKLKWFIPRKKRKK